MNTKEMLMIAIEGVSESLLAEVLDFVLFLQARSAREKLDLAMMSESSLSKEWPKPEEDQAWQDL